MSVRSLLDLPKGYRLESALRQEGQVTLVLVATAGTARCPECHRRSQRIHSRYQRVLADLPISGMVVRLHVRCRRFFCSNHNCPQEIFTERHPGFVEAYARQTERLQKVLRQLGLSVGGNPGARLSAHWATPTSRSTLIRLVRRTTSPQPGGTRVLGVDDWAFRKGHHYGTILCDLEKHRPIDLLADRSAESFAQWLREHPGVEVISRDRAGTYAEGAAKGAPDARQVADRWHLLKNLTEVLERFLDTKRSDIEKAARAVANDSSQKNGPNEKAETGPEDAPKSSDPAGASPSLAEQDRLRRRANRLERYNQVRALRQQGLSLRAIANAVDLSRRTVRRYVRAESFPEIAPRSKRPRRLLDRYQAFLLSSWEGGCHNAAELWRQLRAQGYQGSQSQVQRFLAKLRIPKSSAPGKTRDSKRQSPKASPKATAWLMTRTPDKLDAEQEAYLDELRRACPQIDTAYDLAQTFGRIIKQRCAGELGEWMDRAAQSGIPDFEAFQKSLKQDRDAVSAALTLPWSNGPVEGHVGKLIRGIVTA